LVRGLWACRTDCIIDVCITDVDAKSQRSKDPRKVLEAHEREKKKKYLLEVCLKQRWHFSPFAASTDLEQLVHLLPSWHPGTAYLARNHKPCSRNCPLLAEKWEKPYSEICGYVNARMSIAMVRATHLCLQGSRIPTSEMSNRQPQWEDKAGLGLATSASYFFLTILAAPHSPHLIRTIKY
jgi:hypothetical protein